MEKPTQTQLKEWKAKHGDIFQINSEGKTAYLKKPDRKILSLASVMGKNDPLKYNEIILNNCWLGGDEEIRTDDAHFLGVSGVLADLIEVKETELKKL